MKIVNKTLFTLVMLSVSAVATAMPINCGSAVREATLDSAVAGSCMTGSGNATKVDVDGYYGPDWTEVGEATSSGSSGLLTVTPTGTSAWGSAPFAADWSIDSSFWVLYAEAVISMHVGNGGGDPDHWTWMVTANNVAGTLDYVKHSGGGGGMSNVKLFGRGQGMVTVPEPATLLLLGLGLIAIGRSRKPS